MKNNKVSFVSCCSKCKKLCQNAQMIRIEDAIICSTCYKDALLLASPTEYYLLESSKVALLNEPITIED